MRRGDFVAEGKRGIVDVHNRMGHSSEGEYCSDCCIVVEYSLIHC